MSLQIAVNSPPKTSIKTSGATVVMTAIVKVMVLPPGQPPVQLSSMTMVQTHTQTHNQYKLWTTSHSFLSLLQETKFHAKVSMKGKRLSIHADLRRYAQTQTLKRLDRGCRSNEAVSPLASCLHAEGMKIDANDMSYNETGSLFNSRSSTSALSNTRLSTWPLGLLRVVQNPLKYLLSSI